jgi:PBP1b-binding outer membrane lipoprotein LpoB
MKTFITIVTAALLLSGCSVFYDAPRIDADYGQAQDKSWSAQVAYTDYRYAGTIPEGLGGIPSEQTMKVYNQSFGEKSEKQEVFNLDLTGGGSN